MTSTASGTVPVRGKTALSGNAGRTIDSTMAAHLEGTEQWFDDIDPTATGAKTRRSNRRCLCMLVRNVAADVLLPKRCVTWKSGQRGKQVDGYCKSTSEACAGVVDEFLTSAGVPVNDLFWLCVQGPTLMKVAVDATNANIALDDVLIALTAVTSGATTSGRVQTMALTATSTATTDGTQTRALVNRFGRALSARTTADTNGDVLVDTFFAK